MTLRLLTLAVLVAVSASDLRAQAGGVAGRITAKGLPTSGGIVVSLEATGLQVTPPANPVAMDQRDMRFVPHVVPVVKGTTMTFLNSDVVRHNVFSPEGRYNLGTWKRRETRDYTFNQPGVYTQLCRLHPEMVAFIVVLETPYFATTDWNGVFAIANVQPGRYTLVVWSEKLKTARQAITVGAGKPVTITLTLTA